MTLTVKAVQERYGVSQATVLHWISTGQLRGINVGRDPGKIRARWRITESALTEFELTRETTPPAPRNRRRKKQPKDVIQFYE